MDVHLLGDFSHRNLQKLLGYCLIDRDLYLVHEFMERRTLNDYLRKEAAAELPFLKRVKIVVGVARGLAFLQRKQLIIKDWILDGHDIWLDKDFNAKLLNLDAGRMRNVLAQALTCRIGSGRFIQVSLGKVARERIPGELSPSNYPGRHVARDEYPQRHVAREGVEMPLGIVVNVVVSYNVGALKDNVSRKNNIEKKNLMKL
ncbi:probable serine/threonine-protein kinase PIX13 [Tanacetum coccineum]